MHPAWGPYPDTVLQFSEAGLTVDLRRAISPQARTALAQLGLGRSFGVITACNPMGRFAGEPANSRLHAVLSAIVLLRYPGAVRADGQAASGTHREPGWALPISLEEMRELAARFFQNAVFWFEEGRFQIVPVLATLPPLPLPAGRPAS